MAKDKDDQSKEKKRIIPKNLEELKKGIQKAHGAGAIMQGRNTIVPVDVFPTGIATIDRALGCGGIPQGRIIELFGMESSGKTTTCLNLIAACQKHFFPKKERNGVAAFVDAEHAFDPIWAAKCGVDTDSLLFSQPNSGEEAFDIVLRLVESSLIDLVVVDSVANLVPMKELDGDMGDSNIGAQARLMSQGLRKISAKLNNSKTTVIFINQVRNKIGVMFGSPETTPGGLALKFYSSVRGDIRKGSPIKDGDTVLGFRPTIKFIKNKCAPPFTSAEFEICVGHPKRPVCGIDPIPSLIEVGGDLHIIEKSSSYFIFDEKNKANGLAAATSYLRDHPEVQEMLKEKIYGVLLERVHTAIESEGDGTEEDDVESALSDDILDGVRDGDD